MFEWLRGRYGPRAATLDRDDLLEDFTEGSRRVVALTQEEARGLGHNYTGTEHILLALLREDQGIAPSVLKSLGVDADEAKVRVESIVGHDDAEPVGEELPPTPRLRKVLQLARREALHLSQNHVSPEHLLLGLARESEGVASRVLADLGVDRNEVRRRVQRELGIGE